MLKLLLCIPAFILGIFIYHYIKVAIMSSMYKKGTEVFKDKDIIVTSDWPETLKASSNLFTIKKYKNIFIVKYDGFVRNVQGTPIYHYFGIYKSAESLIDDMKHEGIIFQLFDEEVNEILS